jgi:hypothetical protein
MGELEIQGLNRVYLERGALTVIVLPPGRVRGGGGLEASHIDDS